MYLHLKLYYIYLCISSFAVYCDCELLAYKFRLRVYFYLQYIFFLLQLHTFKGTQLMIVMNDYADDYDHYHHE